MLPGEPKSFVTRDIALSAYCDRAGAELEDIQQLLNEIAVTLPDPRPEYRAVGARLEGYRKIGAVPYRPTPRGGRTPTDPELIAAVVGLLDSEAKTASEIAELLDEDGATVSSVLRGLLQRSEVFAEGRGTGRRFYVVDEEN
jgi:hypothetical protein